MVTHKGRTMRQDDKNNFLLTEMPYSEYRVIAISNSLLSQQ